MLPSGCAGVGGLVGARGRPPWKEFFGHSFEGGAPNRSERSAGAQGRRCVSRNPWDSCARDAGGSRFKHMLLSVARVQARTGSRFGRPRRSALALSPPRWLGPSPRAVACARPHLTCDGREMGPRLACRLEGAPPLSSNSQALRVRRA